MTVYDTLTFYRRRVVGGWRWRYVSHGNYQKMANGGESYQSLNEAREAAFRVCGLDDVARDLIDPDVYHRANAPSVLVLVQS